jgi:hypothetical protein
MIELLDPALVKFLIQSGILGVVCVIFILLYRGATKELKECNEARVVDVKTIAKVAENNTEAFTKFTVALEESNRGREALASALTAQAMAIDNLRLTMVTRTDMQAGLDRLEGKLK